MRHSDERKASMARHLLLDASHQITNPKHSIFRSHNIRNFVQVSRTPNGTSDLERSGIVATGNQDADGRGKAFNPMVKTKFVLVDRKPVRPVAKSGLVTQTLYGRLGLRMCCIDANHLDLVAATPFIRML
ncbi:MAG: hypothetical protein U1A77_23530 [Pirellulales bacterium]